MYEFNCGYCRKEITMDHAWMLSFAKEEVHLDCRDPYGFTLNEVDVEPPGLSTSCG